MFKTSLMIVKLQNYFEKVIAVNWHFLGLVLHPWTDWDFSINLFIKIFLIKYFPGIQLHFSP